MLNLIIKDLLFNKKQCIYGLLGGMLVSLMIIDDVSFSLAGIILVPGILFSFIVGRMCYLEDNISVKSLLQSLPIKKSDIVISKYLEGYLTFIISYIILILANFIIGFFYENRYDLTSYFIIIGFSIVNIYNSLYLYLNFRYNYETAQKAVYVLLGIFFLAAFGYKYMAMFGIDNMSMMGISICVIMISVLTSILFCYLSIKNYNKD
ncbi:MAG: ABC-2 transporter permease [Clostridium sp.]